MLDVGESAVEKTNPIVRLLFACGGEAFEGDVYGGDLVESR
jgi:hypothetical protein